MKYLYPFECDRLKLSTPVELQAAIDGNRREGRRSTYTQFDTHMQNQLGLVSTTTHVNDNIAECEPCLEPQSIIEFVLFAGDRETAPEYSERANGTAVACLTCEYHCGRSARQLAASDARPAGERVRRPGARVPEGASAERQGSAE